MATIGLYGVYFSKATLTNGVVSAYTGVKTMGKAINFDFSPADIDANPLYANNGIAENDGVGANVGDLSLTLDRLTADAYTDLFGLASSTVTVTVGESSVNGTAYKQSGSERSNVVGVAVIRWNQLDDSRSYHEVVILGACKLKQPTDSAQTLGETVEWQTPELSGVVYGPSVCGEIPWKQNATFPTQAAAIQYIQDVFAAPVSAGTGNSEQQ